MRNTQERRKVSLDESLDYCHKPAKSRKESCQRQQKRIMNFIENYLRILKDAKQIINACRNLDDFNSFNLKKAGEIYLNAFHALIESGYPYKTENGKKIIEIGEIKYVATMAELPAAEAKQADKEVFIRHHEPTEKVDDEEYVTDIEDMTLPPDELKEEQEESATQEIEEETEVAEFQEQEEGTEETEPQEPEEYVEEPTLEEEFNGDNMDLNAMEEPGFDVMEGVIEEPELEMGPEDFEPFEEDGPENISEPEEDVVEQESDLGEPEPTEKQEEAVPEGKTKEEVINPEPKLTPVPKTKRSNMPDHMHKDDFTFNFDRIRVSNADGSISENARLLVMPLSIDEDEPEILACAIINRKSHVVVSKDGVASIDIAGHKVEIRGRMDGGIFASWYKIRENNPDDDIIIRAKSKHHGTSGHIVLDDDGVVVHVLPAGLSNNEKGDADFVYYINVNGEEKVGDTSDGKPVTFMYQGNKLRLTARWKDNDTMYCHVSEYEDDM